MFTGIVEEVGKIESFRRTGEAARIAVGCGPVLADAREGSSIAVNGVCLTATALTGTGFQADLAPETLRRTNLGDLREGQEVNLERPLAVGGRLDGHVVQGHVDGTGELVALDPLGDGNWWLRIRIPEELDRYVVYKGSIAIDGISLTVASIENCILSATIIPHTFSHTALHGRKAGSRVNLECDIFAKYLEKMAGR